jgi:hypothetical protein
MTASMVRRFAALRLSIALLAVVPIAATAATRPASLNREKWIAVADHLIQAPPENYSYDWGEACSWFFSALPPETDQTHLALLLKKSMDATQVRALGRPAAADHCPALEATVLT